MTLIYGLTLLSLVIIGVGVVSLLKGIMTITDERFIMTQKEIRHKNRLGNMLLNPKTGKLQEYTMLHSLWEG